MNDNVTNGNAMPARREGAEQRGPQLDGEGVK